MPKTPWWSNVRPKETRIPCETERKSFLSFKNMYFSYNSSHLSPQSLFIHKVSHGAAMEGITTWHVTLRPRCVGTRGRWTSTPGTIQNSTRRSTSASPPTCMAPHTPTRSDCDCTVRSDTEAGGEATVCFCPVLTRHSWAARAQWPRCAATVIPSSLLSHLGPVKCPLIT